MGIDVGEEGFYNKKDDEGKVMPRINLSGIEGLQNIGGGTRITFRLYAWGATSEVGTFAIGRLGGQELVFRGTTKKIQ